MADDLIGPKTADVYKVAAQKTNFIGNSLFRLIIGPRMADDLIGLKWPIKSCI